MTAPIANVRVTASAMLCALLLLTSGCHVEKTRHGDGKDVKIDTPFGGMSVKTEGNQVQAGVGLNVYPGATPEKKDSGDDHAADVNLNFGSFHLGVKAASYTTPDSPARVMTFYRTELARYGNVIECRNGQPIGTPTVTSAGLTCEKEHHNHIRVGEQQDGDLELKAGSQAHQHIVGFTPQGTGTKFGLVLLDMPHDLDTGNDDKQ